MRVFGWGEVVKATSRGISPHKGLGVLGGILIGSLKTDCAKGFWGSVFRRYAYKEKRKEGLIRASKTDMKM